MALLLARIRSRRIRVPQTPQRPLLQRDWYPTRQAAVMLDISERTLRRRLEQPHWIDGRHYRWVTRLSRRTLEINVPQVVRLLENRGWS